VYQIIDNVNSVTRRFVLNFRRICQLEQKLVHINIYLVSRNVDAPRLLYYFVLERGRRGRDCMVVGFTTTYVISAYHH
jgi:hypothetical protein